MKFAYSTNAYMRTTIADAIARVASRGYTGVELMADVPHAWPAETTDDDIARIRAALHEHNLAISNINAFMMNAVEDFWHPSWIEPDEAYRRRRVQHTLDALAMAAKLGAPHITTEPGGPLPARMERSEALSIFIDGLNECLPVAESLGVKLLVEPEPDLLIETADQFLELAARVESPAFGLNFDVGHFFCVGEDLPKTVARLAHQTVHYHLEDIPTDRKHQHMIPGTGAIDFPPLLRAIAGTNYASFLTVELYPYLDDPDRAGQHALRFLQDALDS